MGVESHLLTPHLRGPVVLAQSPVFADGDTVGGVGKGLLHGEKELRGGEGDRLCQRQILGPGEGTLAREEEREVGWGPGGRTGLGGISSE